MFCEPGEGELARILVVDDDALVRETIIVALEIAGHSVRGASYGALALEALGRESFDLVVSDIFMPDTDGIGLLMSVRQRYPHLPVICVSGGSRDGSAPDQLDVSLELGAHGILRKPFTPRQLLAAVETVLSLPSSAEGKSGEDAR